MLHEYIQRLANGHTRFHGGAAVGCSVQGAFDCGELHKFKRVRGHAGDGTGRARTVAAAPGALQQACNPLGAAHLNDLIDWREVHAQVEA